MTVSPTSTRPMSHIRVSRGLSFFVSLGARSAGRAFGPPCCPLHVMLYLLCALCAVWVCPEAVGERERWSDRQAKKNRIVQEENTHLQQQNKAALRERGSVRHDTAGGHTHVKPRCACCGTSRNNPPAVVGDGQVSSCHRRR